MLQVSTIINNFAPSIVSEDGEACGATGTAAIAAVPVALFSVASPKRQTKKTKKKLTMREAVGLVEMNHSTDATAPSVATTDTDAIIAKLKKAEKTNAADDGRDVQTFGITDDADNVIRVSVSSEDADGFERYLQTKLADPHQHLDVAELIYDAREQYDIVDIVWPEVEEDEETDATLDIKDKDGNPIEEPAEQPPMDNMVGAPADDSGAESVLTKVIDMMKADAEARKADAEARAMEAKHKEAKMVVQHSSDRVKHEEQLLDMEAWEKAKKEQEKESKQLAKLARWKHHLKQDSQGAGEDEFGGSEEEEQTNRVKPRELIPAAKQPTLARRASVSDLTSHIISRIKP